MSNAKYKRGTLITSLDELAEQTFVYWGSRLRPIHRGWFLSWQFRMAKNAVDRGVLYRAERRNDDEQPE